MKLNEIALQELEKTREYATAAHQTLNDELFEGKLKQVRFFLGWEEEILGRYRPPTQEGDIGAIELSTTLLDYATGEAEGNDRRGVEIPHSRYTPA